MPSITPEQAALLNHCVVGPPVFDTAPANGLLGRLPLIEVEGGCYSYAAIREQDKPPLTFIASGGTMNDSPVQYGASVDATFAHLAVQLEVARDIAENVSLVRSVVDDQAEALGGLAWAKAYDDAFATTAVPDSVTTFASMANVLPANTIVPAAGIGTPLTLRDLERMLALVSPWSDRLMFLMHPRLWIQVHQLARTAGGGIEHQRDPKTGERTAYFDGVEVQPCSHISLSEGSPDRSSVYLLRLDDPEGNGVGLGKIRGVAGIVPVGRRNVEVSVARPAEDSDTVLLTVSLDLNLVPGSRGSVVRLTSIQVVAT